MKGGSVFQINWSDGGVPKRAVEVAKVRTDGLHGDTQARPAIHGGPDRALCLFSKEHIDALATQGHPIAPGTAGENLTLAGLDWPVLEPGRVLCIGDEIEILITSYADPCRTIAGSFSDRKFSRLNHRKHPGWSRLYAQVLRGGTVHVGDSVAIGERVSLSTERPVLGTSSLNKTKEHKMERTQLDPELNLTLNLKLNLSLNYVNLYVTDLERSLAFFRDTLGVSVQYADTNFGYASLDVGPIRMGLAQVDTEDEDQRALVGRQTGIGFATENLTRTHDDLASRGVVFSMKPAKQPWGALMAMFEDPDGNVFYLDETPEG